MSATVSFRRPVRRYGREMREQWKVEVGDGEPVVELIMYPETGNGHLYRFTGMGVADMPDEARDMLDEEVESVAEEVLA